MSDIENLTHSLAIIYELGVKVDDALDKKKDEVKIASAVVEALSELSKLHKEFMEKNKQELDASIKEGKLAAEFARFTITVSNKSNDLIKKFLNEKTALYNAKRGEVIGFDSNVKLLKSTYDMLLNNKKALQEAKKLAEEEKLNIAALKETSKVEEVVEEVQEKAKSKPGRKRKRPDESGRVSETVQRLKKSRSSKK